MPKKISSSCDPEVEHIIYDCEEIVPFSNGVGLQLLYLEKEGFEGRIIGVMCVDMETKEHLGLMLTLEKGVFIRQPLTHPKLSFIAKDENGKIRKNN